MSGNDETPSSQPPLSLDDAERLASQFTALWDDVPEGSAAAPASPPEEPPPKAPAPSEAPPEDAVAAPPPPSEPAAASEPTPAMVAMAAPMGSSPDIDPNGIELPARRSDYAPPRPLAAAQRTMVGLAPPPPVQVTQSATTTPLGIAAPRSSRPALHVVAESSAIGMEAVPARAPEEPRVAPSALADRSRDSEPDLELPTRRKQSTRLVVGVMSVAAVLVGAGAIRAVFFKRDDTVTPPHVSAQTTQHAPAATNTEPAAEQKTAAPLPAESVAQPEATNTAAPAASDTAAAAERSAPTESSTPPAPPATGVRLAATRTSSESTQTKVVDTSKARTAQRVEEPKHVQRPVRTPVVRRPHTEAAGHASVSPQGPGSGAIVRQSPF